jgi:lysyl-tRNA synthetase class 2
MAEDEVHADDNHIVAERREKLARLRSRGYAFPNDFSREHTAAELHDAYGEASKEELDEAAVETAVAGRIVLRRGQGRASFLTLQDVSGRIQIYVRQDKVGKEVYGDFKAWDVGDIIGVSGGLMRTNTGELTVQAGSIRMLTKSLRPLPEKHAGLTDTETRYRQRYLDLMMNAETRDVFIKRSKIVDGLRRYFIERDFMEVETPMMQSTPGGASAEPFITHYNALDVDMYLRVAPELNLKRLVVGGFERVFEINRNFRNEGMDTKHSPEFTMLEFYCAYADYREMMDLTEDLLRDVAETVLGATTFTYKNVNIDFGKPFRRMTMDEAIVEFSAVSPGQLHDIKKARQLARDLGIDVHESWGLGKLVMEIFESEVEDKIQQPLFITQHPTEVSPLARRNDGNEELTDRFELFTMGVELANGFSELNDPEDQAERFREQAAARAAGDHEAMYYDEDYITALEYGLPPTAGEGIGVDRLVMLLTDSPSVRDVVLFPHMRPKR